jgi:four helix bundle protein
MKDFKRLDVWRKAHDLVLHSYRATAAFPKADLFGLVSQIRRCAASIPANIAEGCGRTGDNEMHRFLQIAAGSANELEYHFLLARHLAYLCDDAHVELEKQVVEVRRSCHRLLTKVNRDRRMN